MTSPLLGAPGAVPGPNGRTALHYGDPLAEQRALAAGTAVVDLSDLGVVTVAGPDRLNWLHSITTANLEHLPPGHSTELLVLSPHGHVEHAAAVVDDGTVTWLITETAPALAAWLTSMRFMMRAEVVDRDDVAVLGRTTREAAADALVTWTDCWPQVIPGGTRYGPDAAQHPGTDWRLTLDVVDRNRLAEAADTQLAGTWALEALRIAAGRPRFADVDHRTLPHELDWLRTAVHLEKGCYRGQESVARVHNLGRPPRRLVLLHLDGSENTMPEPGAEVLADQKPVGSVTAAAYHHDLGPIGLAVVKRALPLTATITVSTPSGPIAAAQVELVGTEGISPDRPPARGPLAKGLERKSLL